jgi:hypothetical protein
MVDIRDVNGVLLVIDAVADPVLPTPCAPQACERSLKRHPDAAGLRRERSLDELQAAEAAAVGRVSLSARRAPGDDTTA